ncbi:hypothetical protein [Meiothermus granaticius]|uniref:Uncharacterized protein n=1 Tax=Meiothermus granaticius NBRC 107808 TaxID=1227551 RepID=A0A399FD51_9DEIN|nr:hypothetical protein [Meiothermus granaticius]MCL6525608.1 hypothetical protein [Thermaceae bacterium]RIH93716.1 hypothetical protein Mgrana_00299 [Meiothermus granaticius NBRC 107808]GEM85761.1 hypothetical protein MGR01S_03860 [Meiothermus granaticius NBRC 107808]
MTTPKLFVIRVWLEPTGEGGSVWRASATNTRTGERRYFQHPSELVQFLNASVGGAMGATEPSS